jgi:hypothetical protein
LPFSFASGWRSLSKRREGTLRERFGGGGIDRFNTFAKLAKFKSTSKFLIDILNQGRIEIGNNILVVIAPFVLSLGLCLSLIVIGVRLLTIFLTSAMLKTIVLITSDR